MKNTNQTIAPRSIEELQKEIAVLEAKDTATTKRVSKELRLDGIDTLDAESVNCKAPATDVVPAVIYAEPIAVPCHTPVAIVPNDVNELLTTELPKVVAFKTETLLIL